MTNEVTLSTQIGEAIELTETQKAKAASIMEKYPELFSSEVNKMRLANVARMPIKIQRGAKPVRVPERSYSFEDQVAQRQIIKDWLSQGVIRKSNSPWNSPPMVVRAQSKPSLVVDYTQLNSVTAVT
jgi:hypothetical protein